MRYIPESIKNIVGDGNYVVNDVGMSESEVLIFPKYVLKIQQHTPETDNERNMAAWLGDSIPLPKISEYCVHRNTAYTLMSRVKGQMLCDEEYLNNPDKLIELVAAGLKILWSVDISKCPYTFSRLDNRLKEAVFNVENNLVDLDNVEPETFGDNGFSGPEELIGWLEQNRPKEDLVLTHGDFCLPNIFTDGSRITGFIDLGKMGPADRWQDIAVAIRSLEHNFSGKYSDGITYFDFKPQMLLDKLGIDMDGTKNRYYRLLDELF